MYRAIPFQSHENEIQNTCNYYQYSDYVNYLLLIFNKAICICAFLSFSLLCRKVNCTPYKRRKTCIPVHAKANGRLRPYNFKRLLLWLLNKIMVQWLPAKHNCVWMMLFETGSRWVKGEIVPSPTVISISILSILAFLWGNWIHTEIYYQIGSNKDKKKHN